MKTKMHDGCHPWDMMNSHDGSPYIAISDFMQECLDKNSLLYPRPPLLWMVYFLFLNMYFFFSFLYDEHDYWLNFTALGILGSESRFCMMITQNLRANIILWNKIIFFQNQLSLISFHFTFSIWAYASIKILDCLCQGSCPYEKLGIGALRYDHIYSQYIKLKLILSLIWPSLNIKI